MCSKLLGFGPMSYISFFEIFLGPGSMRFFCFFSDFFWHLLLIFLENPVVDGGQFASVLKVFLSWRRCAAVQHIVGCYTILKVLSRYWGNAPTMF